MVRTLEREPRIARLPRRPGEDPDRSAAPPAVAAPGRPAGSKRTAPGRRRGTSPGAPEAPNGYRVVMSCHYKKADT